MSLTTAVRALSSSVLIFVTLVTVLVVVPLGIGVAGADGRAGSTSLAPFGLDVFTVSFAGGGFETTYGPGLFVAPLAIALVVAVLRIAATGSPRGRHGRHERRAQLT